MTALDKLIEAVEGGEYPPVDYYPTDWAGMARVDWMYDAFEGSLDAAKALHEALLQGWFANLEVDRNFAVVNAKRGLRQRGFTSMSVNPARAWLIAILKAYRSQL